MELDGVGKAYKLLAGFDMESINKKAKEADRGALGFKSKCK